MAAVSLIIGLASVVALNVTLTDRVDAQLRAAEQRSQTIVDRTGTGLEAPPDTGSPPGGRPPGPDFLLAPGQGVDTVAALIRDGQVQRSAVLDNAGSAQPLTEEQNATLLQVPADDTPHTVNLAADLGDYRATAFAGPDGTRLVTALPLRGVQDAVSRVVLVICLVTLGGLLIAAGAGSVIVRAALRPLQRVAGTATRVAQLPLHSGEVSLAERVPERDTDPRTEVGQVGSALNRMLGHVEAALDQREESERRTRQFVADASHELRTPLAAILGYAELTRRAPYDLPPDVVHAVGRVESEAHRMSGLVHDLLLLARLDTDPGVGTQDVDLRRVLTDAVSDAHATGPEHHWSLSLPDVDVRVQGDPDRIHQVLTNLLSNARVHTPAGTAIRADLTTAPAAAGDGAGQEAVIVVTDEGPGIPAELQARVFQRFARGDTSRSRRAGSTGLGLAIVAAIVSAHRGTVSVDSRPGHTAFTVRLPIDANI
ncbi:MAG: HAMP domain-containing sensor histidine kinase [Ornithinimicrobium sp.]